MASISIAIGTCVHSAATQIGRREASKPTPGDALMGDQFPTLSGRRMPWPAFYSYGSQERGTVLSWTGRGTSSRKSLCLGFPSRRERRFYSFVEFVGFQPAASATPHAAYRSSTGSRLCIPFILSITKCNTGRPVSDFVTCCAGLRCWRVAAHPAGELLQCAKRSFTDEQHFSFSYLARRGPAQRIGRWDHLPS
ncbi:hypothetical protein BKA62DRAFT_357889 [Auriculariales sp. MPI-PUGE-AT-0066]|nr:hypothetical protein BKA62DRAFT_357889 [Auriculariales sp. MPI-PUGE-AT-0066]